MTPIHWSKDLRGFGNPGCRRVVIDDGPWRPLASMSVPIDPVIRVRSDVRNGFAL